MKNALTLPIILVCFFACQAQEKTHSKQKQSCRSDSGAVCGQPPMPPCPKGQMCAQVMPKPKMYSDECELKKMGATPLPQKACQGVETK